MLWQRQLLIVLCRWMALKLRRRTRGRWAMRGQWRNSGLLAGILVHGRLSRCLVDGIRSLVDGIRSRIDGIRSLVDGIRSLVDGIRSRIDGIRSLVDGIRSLAEGRSMVPGFLIIVGRSVVERGGG
jgi:hypothetical protein